MRNPEPRATYEANTFMDWVSDAPSRTLLPRLLLINAHGSVYVNVFGSPYRGAWMIDEKA